MNNIKQIIEENKLELIELRRHLHQNPELSFNEFETTKYIKEFLDKYNIENEQITETGIIAYIGNADKVIALRADIDALPINEETDLDFKSKNLGIMHACGHDFHTSILMMTAKILKQFENKLNCKVMFIFQPAEEKLPGGAKVLIQNGLFNKFKPEAVFGQHIYPEAETETISISPGYIMAAPDELYWTITGKGGHAAQPHLNSDTILASAHLVMHLQSLISKNKNPLQSAVLSVTSIQGGTAPNIFPEKVNLMGTLRTFNKDLRNQYHKLLNQHSEEICKLHNCDCTLEIREGYPPVYNDTKATEFVKNIASKIFGTNKVLNFEPKMWGEDFGFYSELIPSTFWFLGVKPNDNNEIYGLHNSKLSPNENALSVGVELFVNIAMNYK